MLRPSTYTKPDLSVQTSKLPESRSETYATIVVFAFLLLLAIGTNPFMEGSGIAIDKSGGGDSLRQVIMLALIVTATPLFFTRQQQLLQILLSNKSLLFVVGWSILSIFWSDVMDIAARRLFGTLLAAAITLIAASLSPRRLVNVLLMLTGTIMTINYLGIIFIPSLALDYDGFWEGLHTQKNVAGNFSAVSGLLWLFMGFVRKNNLLLIGGVSWGVFLYFTHSSTSIGMFLAVLPIGMLFRAGLRRGFDCRTLLLLVFAVLEVPLLIYVALTLLADFFSELDFSFSDITFTGRTEIWQFVWETVVKSPFIGVGFFSFWAIGDLSPSLLYASEFVAQYTEAHNGYLDVLVSIGAIGMAFTVSALVRPYALLRFYKSSETDTETQEALLCALLLLTFGILHNTLESSLFQGLTVLWTLMLMSIWVITSHISSN
jgi:O-antigen ligase